MDAGTPLKTEMRVSTVRKHSCICFLGEIVSNKSSPRTKSLSSTKWKMNIGVTWQTGHRQSLLGVGDKLSKTFKCLLYNEVSETWPAK